MSEVKEEERTSNKPLEEMREWAEEQLALPTIGWETNNQRAAAAFLGVDAFIELSGQDWENDGPKEIIGDLICDLLHLADIEGVSIDLVLANARRYHEEEVLEAADNALTEDEAQALDSGY
jgi:hypothetical protein